MRKILWPLTVIALLLAALVPLRGFVERGLSPVVRVAQGPPDDGAGPPPKPNPGGAPAAPSDLRAMPGAFGKIILTWRDNSTNETGFQVERLRETGQKDWLPIYTAAPNATAYEDAMLSSGMRFRYRIRAVNGEQSSPYTAEADATVDRQGYSAGYEDPDLMPMTDDDPRAQVDDVLFMRQPSGWPWGERPELDPATIPDDATISYSPETGETVIEPPTDPKDRPKPIPFREGMKMEPGKSYSFPDGSEITAGTITVESIAEDARTEKERHRLALAQRKPETSLPAGVRAGSMARVYVAAGPRARRDGKTWKTALASVRQGVAAARAGGEVWVAAGTYHERVVLDRDVRLLGGFAGGEIRADQRDPAKSRAILDAGHKGSALMIPAGRTRACLVEGFTLTGGTGSLDPAYSYNSSTYGGGVYCEKSSPTLRNNVIAGNTATYGGAGVYCDGGSPLIERNVIRDNRTRHFGAGVYVRHGGAASIKGNTFTGNETGVAGAALGVNGASPTIGDNVFNGNQGYSGGAVWVYGAASPVFTACHFAGNVAETYGGAALVQGRATPVFRACSFSENRALAGGALWSDGSPHLEKNTMRANTARYGRSIVLINGPAALGSNALPDGTGEVIRATIRKEESHPVPV